MLVGLLVVVTAGLIGLLVVSLRALKRAGRGIGKVMRLLDDDPWAGLAVVAEFLVWGSGFLLRGYPARGLVMLAIWLVVLLLAHTLIGLLIAVPAYWVIAPHTAAALYELVAPGSSPSLGTSSAASSP